MADSDNSRTLSTVTRGDFYSFVAASLPTSQEFARATRLPSDACNDDPALVVWQQWCNAREHLSESTLRQQRHESSLFSVVLPPPLEQFAGSRTYSEALEAEDRASIAEEQAAESLWETPAVSIAGAAAKLHAAMTKWQPSPTSQEEPWPQIRSVIADLLKIDTGSVASRLSMPERQPELQGD
ncbi:hypothetical protein [Sinorhizobium meliloti]|uniref:Uncharacterized protein n=1 Tax=Rhizobium meliloti (strain 1021) TaxID=266834 RepID=Q92VU0_RHIME|nr:hypothetical protein [Sinorhizobium meliloti]AGG71620.1 Hypothetical protein SM2011_b21036 [Sinorhizobium meliloti 2011]ASP62172.1 hypothetical protein CDO30_28680 [Sinorhizobium meliloti]MCK3804831.1 hypothetical protein [Sinorhizobium meliloti]MCK3810838.1 hypothetical protein [Sinorhizobium meliloti]MCK3815876.1 hypothetical protein [Sinorhizobium meliloti]